MCLILSLLLLIVAAPAWAAWEFVYEGPTGTVHFDPATLSRRGNIRSVWVTWQGTWLDTAPSLSPPPPPIVMLDLIEFDCVRQQVRKLSSSSQMGGMQFGSPTQTPNAVWERITTPSAATLLVKVCGL